MRQQPLSRSRRAAWRREVAVRQRQVPVWRCATCRKRWGCQAYWRALRFRKIGTCDGVVTRKTQHNKRRPPPLRTRGRARRWRRRAVTWRAWRQRAHPHTRRTSSRCHVWVRRRAVSHSDYRGRRIACARSGSSMASSRQHRVGRHGGDRPFPVKRAHRRTADEMGRRGLRRLAASIAPEREPHRLP